MPRPGRVETVEVVVLVHLARSSPAEGPYYGIRLPLIPLSETGGGGGFIGILYRAFYRRQLQPQS